MFHNSRNGFNDVAVNNVCERTRLEIYKLYEECFGAEQQEEKFVKLPGHEKAHDQFDGESDVGLAIVDTACTHCMHRQHGVACRVRQAATRSSAMSQDEPFEDLWLR